MKSSVALFFALSLALTVRAAKQEFFVDPNSGNDETGDGTRARSRRDPVLADIRDTPLFGLTVKNGETVGGPCDDCPGKHSERNKSK